MGIGTIDDVHAWLDSPEKHEKYDRHIASVEAVRERIRLSREDDPKKEKISSRWGYSHVLEDLDVYVRFFQSDPSVSWDTFWEAEQRLAKNKILPDGWEKVEKTRLTVLWVPESEQTSIIVRKKVVCIHPKT